MNKQLEQVSRVTTECMSFIWKIENFLSLQVKTGEFVRSSVVQCSDSHWCLKLFPNGKYKSKEVKIFLEHAGFTSSPNLPTGVRCKIGLRNRSGENCFKLPSVLHSPSSSNGNKFLSSSNVSSDSLQTTVTTNAPSTSEAPPALLTNTLSDQSSSFSFGTTDDASRTAPLLSGATTAPSFQSPKDNCTSAVSTRANASMLWAKDSVSSGVSSPKTTFGGLPLLSGATTAPSFQSPKDNCTPAVSTTANELMFWFKDSVPTGMPSPKTTSGGLPCSSHTNPKSSGLSSSVGTRAKDSLLRSSLSSDKLGNSIQKQSLIISSISTKGPKFCFLNKKDKTLGSTWASKSVSFLEAGEEMIVPRELLFKMAEDLLPNDVLTVVCEMEITIVVKVSESTLAEGNTSSNDGTELLIENLQNAFENPRFSDVTLKVGDVQFPAHKIILANRSKVFDAMFDSEMKESQENVVDLVDMEPSTAKDMLSYIYTGNIQELSMDRATDLFVVADRYVIPELRQWCKDFILKHITPGFACEVAILANLHGDADLAEASKQTIKNNLKAVLNCEKWLSLSKESPAVYLELLQVALTDESD